MNDRQHLLERIDAGEALEFLAAMVRFSEFRQRNA